MPSEPNRTRDAGGTRARVMVVDDNPGVLQSLILLLNHFGFEVAAFDDPNDALAEVHNYKPDVLICDAHVDDIDSVENPVSHRVTGIDTATKVKHVRPQCRVIVMSGNIKPSAVTESAHRAGAEIVTMPKPAHPADLMSAVDGKKVA